MNTRTDKENLWYEILYQLREVDGKVCSVSGKSPQ
jgi:hypothetical protein